MAPTIPERLMRVETQLEQVREQVADLRQRIDGLQADMGEIKEILTQARGGWRMLFWIGSFASVAGGAVSWMAGKLWPLIGTLPR